MEQCATRLRIKDGLTIKARPFTCELLSKGLPMSDSNVSNAEIKSLLILLLLKGGTRAEEIQTALQMVNVSRFMADQRAETEPQQHAPVHYAPAQQAPAPRIASITPKQIVRNTYLAPMQQYYAA
jgi:hypothetical protein